MAAGEPHAHKIPHPAHAPPNLSWCHLPNQAEESSDEDDDDGSHGSGGRGGGKTRRVMANRQSAQRSRMRKLQFISDLENNVSRLQVRAA